MPGTILNIKDAAWDKKNQSLPGWSLHSGSRIVRQREGPFEFKVRPVSIAV